MAGSNARRERHGQRGHVANRVIYPGPGLRKPKPNFAKFNEIEATFIPKTRTCDCYGPNRNARKTEKTRDERLDRLQNDTTAIAHKMAPEYASDRDVLLVLV